MLFLSQVRRTLRQWQWNSIREGCINCVSARGSPEFRIPLLEMTAEMGKERCRGKGEINKNAKRKLATRKAATMAEAPPPFSWPLFICFAFRRVNNSIIKRSMKINTKGLRSHRPRLPGWWFTAAAVAVGKWGKFLAAYGRRVMKAFASRLLLSLPFLCIYSLFYFPSFLPHCFIV